MTSLTPGGPFRAIAHRGEPIGHRENTLPGVAAALQAGADIVEIDVKVTADGQVVLLHDLTLDRLWNDPRTVTEVDHDQIEQIPSLAAALELIGPSGKALLIDMDSEDWAEPSRLVVAEAVRSGVITVDQAIWCGRFDSLRVIREADPQARIIFSWDEGDQDGRLPSDAMVADLAPEAFNPHWPMVDDAVLGWIADHGLASCCWTVDDEAVMRQLLDRGVTAMITNRIGLLQELRR
ncbi:glycerophosphodiester phosphodiesterase [Microlunatus soli]|uniref:Glycerophosphoryl diester phosphodiesterase n=1 Tax=Microlunatus soli TaxID=630515 RepID=A0A1H1Y8M2_9ACTN|nr:glycerophosphodiester phosphodiesterase [Microlunatus soli]SDT17724.1 glycerophosphoryl diester phosphodiesterase [Microlunatus soli]